jgi:hypothetical protein
MPRFTYLSLIFLLFVLGTSISAQNRYDFGIWSGLKVDQKIYKSLSYAFKGQVRLEGNANYFRNALSDLSLSYKFHKLFTLRGGYRYTLGNKNNRHRGYLDAISNIKIANTGLKFNVRLRSQYDTRSDYIIDQAAIFRGRLYVSYKPKIKKFNDLSFYSTAEAFYEINNLFSQFNKWRFSFGLNYELSKNISLHLRYILQDDIDIKAAVMENIFMIYLSVDLPDLIKKNKKKK